MPQDYRWASHRYYVQAKGRRFGSNSRGNGTDWGETSVSRVCAIGKRGVVEAYYEANVRVRY